ncbi:MAG TPA: TetR/AcrR family transcriptional regulator [Gammaproteobacteria bacterium]
MAAIPSKPRKRRKPGRPARSQNQREHLLDTAVACYARDGVTATSARTIAAAAGVTPALVNYYFGSKERLLEAVVQERLMPVVLSLRDTVAAAGESPAAVAAAFVRGIHAAVARHPWLPSIWVREILTENGALREAFFERVSPLVPRLLAERFGAARQSGALPEGLDPRLVVVSLIGLTFFPLAGASIWRRLFDAHDVDNEALQRHTLALLRQGLGAPP